MLTNDYFSPRQLLNRKPLRIVHRGIGPGPVVPAFRRMALGKFHLRLRIRTGSGGVPEQRCDGWTQTLSLGFLTFAASGFQPERFGLQEQPSGLVRAEVGVQWRAGAPWPSIDLCCRGSFIIKLISSSVSSRGVFDRQDSLRSDYMSDREPRYGIVQQASIDSTDSRLCYLTSSEVSTDQTFFFYLFVDFDDK